MERLESPTVSDRKSAGHHVTVPDCLHLVDVVTVEYLVKRSATGQKLTYRQPMGGAIAVLGGDHGNAVRNPCEGSLTTLFRERGGINEIRGTVPLAHDVTSA